MLAVHAHPDDESIWTGLMLAQAVRTGVDVQVVTCTMGEEGEVIGEKYQNLVTPTQREGGTGLLGGYRIAELQRALEALGIEGGPQFLGGVGAWRDSGMAGSESIRMERAFAGEGQEKFDQQVTQLVEKIREFGPEVVVTYGPDGGYGHPDHIRAHRVTHAAVERMEREDEPIVREIWWCVTERQRVDEALIRLREAYDDAPPPGWRWPEDGEIAAVDAAEVTFRVKGEGPDLVAKVEAMRAHATQIWVADGQVSDVNPEPRNSQLGAFCLSNLITQPLLAVESYTVGYRAAGA
ncbi:MAG TPA: N-acetyl-1-D-myo-inositol-2-amino-2-deoxy-alpha-D-glucopyranoside deacetylase [Candidatus Corynebacterium gallistercoris]|uniref:N-acetyl-1-D-myo-inositol-2-amino-2-deoxy-alpha-D-glucopyranoside deacetylase n=1 Tax=Candidatus Corynebacterium gallistercoris TaxID=2838530 RepID=A0A9D1RY61_9CORY|nr:N-acetyl-1-D-myo-inositol-2-amino-2-deoxy-alpha-D-glucopyranoside deacetylase [Candidatus Corynebacterium gallistercoris]